MRNVGSSPSAERRAKLKKAELNKIPNISNMIPIQRYYTVALKLLQRFTIAVKNNELDEAYIYGIRFAKFSSNVLPTHDYYKLSQKEYRQLRNDNQNDIKRVIDELENVVELMDLEELEKREIRRREEEAMRLIKEREEQMRKEAEERAATQSLLDRLHMLDNIGSVPTGVVERKEKTIEEELEGFDEEDADLPIGNLPMPIPVPYQEFQQQQPPSYEAVNQGHAAPPPSYEALMGQEPMPSAPNLSNFTMDSIANLRPSSSRSLQDMPTSQNMPDPEMTTFINPLGPTGPLLPASLTDHGQVKNKSPPLPFATQKQIAKSDFDSLRGKKKIEEFLLGTYQGRSKVRDSTNGCTVISPLVAVNHLTSEGAGIADVKIEQIIDETAPVILSRVRSKLGLSGHALIIPSDVHDYMVDEKILKQEMFVGVCGGNLIDPDHVDEFLNLLENGEDPAPNKEGEEKKKDNSKKVAAALFFHEHVVSILKVVLPDGSMWYDLVDSMPSSTYKNGQQILGATRTRCKDRESLRALLCWYACEKFSTADAQYIDNNEWDDTMCDFDPRVFQGFVWKELS